MGGADGNEGKNKDSSHFGALVSLMSHVAHCYPTKLGPLADELTELLDTRAAGMTPRLILPRSTANRNWNRSLEPTEMKSTFFSSSSSW